MIGRLFRKTWLLILLFTLVAGLYACIGDTVPGEKIKSSNTPHSVYLSPTNTIVEPETATPENTRIPTGTRPVISAPTTKLTLEPSPTASYTTPPCWSSGGLVRSGKAPTHFLKESLDYRIYFPPCYDQQQDRHYPVLYLFHGQGFSDDQWDRIGVDEKADELIAAGQISPVIIVMPHEIGSEQPTGSKFAQAIIKDFIPYIDATYRTLPDRTNRAVGGLSRGGGWAVHFGISEWELFGAIGAHSPGVFRADDLYLRKWLNAIPGDSYPRIYIDIGDRDLPEILDSATWFEQMLNVKDIPHEWHFFSGYHNEDYWRAHLDSYLRWYTQNW